MFVQLSCNDIKEKNEGLKILEDYLNTDPQYVSNKLDSIAFGLSKNDWPYYGLLKTISDDKLRKTFTSDSLINTVENYYKKHHAGSHNHIRSLLYLGIVRYRMNISDSTVLSPLKEAEMYFSRQKDQNPSIGHLLNLYIGVVLNENKQFTDADKYFEQALLYAKSDNNEKYKYSAYNSKFWNELIQRKHKSAKLYLDTLSSFKNITIKERYDLYGAESAYYNSIKEYEQSLISTKKQASLFLTLKEKADLFRLYTIISNRYDKLNRLDSAIHYAYLAVENIIDTTYVLNYYLYENVAKLAEKQQNYKVANEYRTISSILREKNNAREQSLQIFELEKKYALMESENKALKAKRDNQNLSSIAVILFLILILAYIFILRQRALQKLTKEKHSSEIRIALHRKDAAESLATYTQKQNEIQKTMLSIYAAFIQQYADQVQRLRLLSISTRSKNSKVSDLIDVQLNENQHQFSTITSQIFTPQKIKNFLNLDSSPDYLNHNECLIIFMLACKVENSQIAFLLNTSPTSFKARKNQLKRKITSKVIINLDAATIYELFL